jgi:hypothetical protein
MSSNTIVYQQKSAKPPIVAVLKPPVRITTKKN